MFIFNMLKFLGDIFIFLPDIFFVFSLLFVLVLSLWFSLVIKSLYINKLVIDLTIPFLIISLLLNFELYNIIYSSNFGFLINNFYLFFRLFLMICVILILLIARYYFFFEKIYIFEFVILFLLAIEGSLLLLFSQNFFLFYLAIELQNLCFYVLAALKRYNNYSTEAGLKYFFFGVLSSSFLLFGISLLYGLFGTLNFDEIFFLINFLNIDFYGMVIYLALFLILTSLLIKIGSAPFHWWIPEVYEGAPTIITLIFLTISKIVYVFFICKFFIYCLFFDSYFFSMYFFFMGILSLIFGTFNAIYEFRIKKFFAYSAIANIGFILISFGISTIDGLFASIIFVICYVFGFFIIFFFVINFREVNLKEINTLFELSFLGNNNLLVKIFISMVFFSFVGLPPLIGFFGKFFVFYSLVINQFYLLFFILMGFSIFMGFYYLRVIRFIFFDSVINYKFFYYKHINYFILCVFMLNIYMFFFFDFLGEYIYFFLIEFFIF